MQAAKRSMNPPRRGKGNEKIPTIQSGFLWCTFRASTRLCRVALPHGLSPHGTALRHCPMLRFAFSATGGAQLRIPVTRISAPMKFKSLKHTSKEKTMKLSSHRFSFGALSGTLPGCAVSHCRTDFRRTALLCGTAQCSASLSPPLAALSSAYP